MDTCQPFQQDCPPLLLELTAWHLISAATTLCLAIHTSIQQAKALKSEHLATLCSQYDYAVPRPPEIYRKP